MASKKFLELKEFTQEELTNELTETKAQYGKLKFDHAIKGLENPIVLREVRRDIARLMTEVKRRELEGADAKTIASRAKLIERRRRNK